MRLHTQTIIFGKFPSIIVNNTELLKAPTPPQSNDNSIKFDGNNADGDTLCASYFATNRSIFFLFELKPNFKETEYTLDCAFGGGRSKHIKLLR